MCVFDFVVHLNYWVYMDTKCESDTLSLKHYYSVSLGEQNYPVYGSGLIENRDKEGGRGVIGEESRKVSLRFEEAVGSKLMQQAQHVTYVLFECGGWGPRRNFWKMRERFELQLPKERLAFISLSTTQGSVHARPWDQGLVPP